MKNTNLLRQDRKAAATTAHELAALSIMSVGELTEKYREVFGEPTRSRNKEFLRKRIAWRIQERAEGRGLSSRALARIELLAPEAPARWRQPVTEPHRSGPSVAASILGRDPRLPAPGTVIARVHGGIEHKVTVLADHFEYQGELHRSLSKIAKLITGKSWNGFLFFFRRPQLASATNRERVA